MYNFEGSMATKLVTKHEVGAVRAIYTTSWFNYLISAYVFESFEKVQNIEGTTLNASSDHLDKYYQ